MRPPPRSAVFAATLVLALAAWGARGWGWGPGGGGGGGGGLGGPRVDPLGQALALARDQGRLVLVHFAAPDLPMGAAMAQESFGQARVLADLTRSHLLVELDAREQAALFEGAFGEGGRLGTCVLDDEGEVMGALAGYAPPEGLVLLAERTAGARRAWGASRHRPFERALVLVRLGLWHRAEAALSELLAAGLAPPREARARERLARCLVRQGRVEECEAELARLGASSRGEGRALELTAGLARLAARRPDQALEWLERAAGGKGATDGPEGDALLLALATARHHAGVGDGLAELRELLDRYPRSPWRLEALGLARHALAPPGQHVH